MEKLKVNYIGIKNVLGIKSLEVRPGKINSIDGPNGAGKTSFLKAIKALLNLTLNSFGHWKWEIHPLKKGIVFSTTKGSNNYERYNSVFS